MQNIIIQKKEWFEKGSIEFLLSEKDIKFPVKIFRGVE